MEREVIIFLSILSIALLVGVLFIGGDRNKLRDELKTQKELVAIQNQTITNLKTIVSEQGGMKRCVYAMAITPKITINHK